MQHVVEALAADQPDPQGHGQQKGGATRSGQPPEQGGQQDELGQCDDKVKGTGQIAPDGIARQICQREGEVAPPHKEQVVQHHRQQIGKEDGLSPPAQVGQGGGRRGVPQGELHSAQEEKAVYRDKGEPLGEVDHAVLPAAVVQHCHRVAAAVNPDHQQTEQQI